MLRRIAWGHGLIAVAGTLMITLALPARAVYPIINPPSAPTNVVAVPGDARATVAWQTPATDGGAPITGYRVTSTPASAGCSVGPGVLTCEITGLVNGTSYVFTVQASNSAGLGAAGVSNAVTPQATAPTITIAATRSGGSLFVTGSTKNIPAGGVLSSSVRIEGNTSFAPGPPATVNASGAFSWSTTVPADKGVEVYFSFQGVDSNTASLPADAQTSLAIGGSRSGTTVSISGLSTNIPAGSSVTILTRVNGRGDFAAAGSATVDATGRFSWTGSQPEADQLDVVAEYTGLRSNILSFPGAGGATIVIAGSRAANGRSVSIAGSTTGIAAGSQVEPTVTLDGSPVEGRAVTVQQGGGFTWSRSVGANRTIAVSFSASGATSNLVTLVPGKPTIGITGSRNGGTISVSGLTSSLDEGTALTVFFRAEGDVGFSPQARVSVQADGSFTWSRQLPPTRGAEVYVTGGGATSNTVLIPATASEIVITGTRTGTSISVTGLALGLKAGDDVILRARTFGDARYRSAGRTTVSATGAFTFTTTADLDKGLSVYVTGSGAESNVLSFNPLRPSIVLYGGSYRMTEPLPSVTAFGQAFNVSVGTVLVPFVSLNGGPFTTGVGVRTLSEQGDFTWTRLVNKDVTKVDVYFATADGITSNTITLKR